MSACSPVIKILTQDQYREWQQRLRFEGSPDDLRDGFIHLCTPAQLDSTVRAHFSGQAEVVLLEIDAERLGSDLVFETSRGGQQFPHLYRALTLSDVIRVTPHKQKTPDEPK